MNTTALPAQACRWHVFPDVAELEQAALAFILEAANESIAVRGAFNMVLAGGSTPRKVYQLLAQSEADWQRWHIYFGDERCLPAEHPERNSRMAIDAWLAHVPVPEWQVHMINAELGAEAAATEYAEHLSKIGSFDLVLLGLGEDGHTASLFPGHSWEKAKNLPVTLAVHNAPKLPSDRVSLSPACLSDTRQLLFLLAGAGKVEAVRNWRNGVAIPASRIVPPGGVDIYLDQAAS